MTIAAAGRFVVSTIALPLFRRTTLRPRRLAAAGLVGACLVLGFDAARPPAAPVEIRLLVEPRDTTMPSPAADQGRIARAGRLIDAQIGLLGSADLLRRAAGRVDAATPSHITGLVDLFSGADGGETRLARLIASLSVRRFERTRILTVRLDDGDRARGIRVLQALVDDYLASLGEARTRAAAEIDRRFAAELAEARTALAAAEAAANPVVGIDPVGVAEDRASALAAARADRTAAAAMVQRLERIGASGEAAADRLLDTAATPTLQRLRERRSALRARIAELSVVYLKNHPLMREAEERLADLRREILAELPRALATQKTLVADADRRIDLYEPTMTASLPGGDAAALRERLDALVRRRAAALDEALGAAAVDVRPLGAPMPLDVPAASASPLRVGLGAVAAGLVYVLVAGLRRRLFGPARRGPSRLEPRPSSSSDAADPDPAPPAEGEARSPRDLAAAMAGPARRLWSAVADDLDAGGRIVVVAATAAEAAAGAAALAAAAAADVAGVCAIDLFGTSGHDGEGRPGLSDLLAGRATFSEVLARAEPGLWRVACGATPLADADLLDDGFDGILDALELTFTHLIVDAGVVRDEPGPNALMFAADGLVLAVDDAADPAFAACCDALVARGHRLRLLRAEAAAEAPPRAAAA